MSPRPLSDQRSSHVPTPPTGHRSSHVSTAADWTQIITCPHGRRLVTDHHISGPADTSVDIAQRCSADPLIDVHRPSHLTFHVCTAAIFLQSSKLVFFADFIKGPLFSAFDQKKGISSFSISPPEHGSNEWSWCIYSGTVKMPDSSTHPGLLWLILDYQWPINVNEKRRLCTVLIVAVQKKLVAYIYWPSYCNTVSAVCDAD